MQQQHDVHDADTHVRGSVDVHIITATHFIPVTLIVVLLLV